MIVAALAISAYLFVGLEIALWCKRQLAAIEYADIAKQVDFGVRDFDAVKKWTWQRYALLTLLWPYVLISILLRSM